MIDMVPFFVDGADTPYVRGIVPNVRRLAEGARDAGALVVWVVPGYVAPTAVDVEFLGAEAAAVLARSGGDGEPRERVWGGFDVRDDDLVVEKTAMSAFFPGRSPLPDLLQERGVDTVVVAGTVTNVCCESSVRDASTLGYRVVLVADANAARRDRDHDATLHVVYRTFGDIRSTDDVLALLHATARLVARHVKSVKAPFHGLARSLEGARATGSARRGRLRRPRKPLWQQSSRPSCRRLVR
ncbi:hypothetical protein GCM10025868_31460 [Angustibacter aerolatus]|uniref:Isochorismatase-like domain-containing protein n=1 Tax=Angustibacter aerolatus TaxID=1162965 RepID=A0ABQ6JI28_9ACTN|nr:hypothetical protein GCM10025868_31460 [Angustibacter aerolatus]